MLIAANTTLRDPHSSLAFDAGAAMFSDHRGVDRSAAQNHAIAGLQHELFALLLEHESDRSVDAVEDLFV